MPTFHYESLSSTGNAQSGVITANDRGEVIRMLAGRGETPTNILETKEGAKAPRPSARSIRARRAERPVLSNVDMANLIRELATALEAGLPLMQALKTVRKQAHGRALPVILDHLIARVEAGDPLYAAARDYGPPFSDMIVGMLRAADASGEMSAILHQLADLLDRSIELKREVLGATVYPMIVVFLIIVSAILLVTVFVPRLILPLQGQGFDMPFPTRVVLSLAEFIGAWWMYVVGATLAIWVLWRAWLSAPANRTSFDRFKLRIPALGRLLRDVSVARFTRTLGTLVSSGMPILDALRITRDTLGNAAMAEAIDEVQAQVASGKPLADPLERSGLFPHLLIQVVSLGERSGKLENMLMHAASAFDRNVQSSIKLFTKALPPVLLVIMAMLGGFLLAAILLPMLELQSMVS